MLKKEFKKKDVQRARNLITGKTGASTGTQIGYKKETKDYKEGDVWTEGRKTWTIKNGIKQTVSKLDVIKKEVFMPLSCPCCGKIMKKRLDKPNYKIHKKCHDCVTNMETKMMIKGDYDEYTRKIKNNEIDNKIKDFKVWIKEKVKENNTFVTEQGAIEDWGGMNKQTKEKILKDLKEFTTIMRKHIE